MPLSLENREFEYLMNFPAPPRPERQLSHVWGQRGEVTRLLQCKLRNLSTEDTGNQMSGDQYKDRTKTLSISELKRCLFPLITHYTLH